MGSYPNFKWGEFFVESSPPGTWIKPPGGVIKSGSGWPFLKMETTADCLHPGPPYKTGGPFRNIKYEYDVPANGLVGNGTYYSNFKRAFNGSIVGTNKYVGSIAGFPSNWSGTVSSMSLAGPILYGSQLPNTQSLDSGVWDRTKPRIEQGGLFVAFAEIRDVHRMLHTTAKGYHEIWKALGGEVFPTWKHRFHSWAMRPKVLADHFINHNFGWVPFVKDVHAVCSNIVNYKDRIARLTRENGNWVRRRAVLVNQVEEGVVARGDGTPDIWPLNTSMFDDYFAIDGTGHYSTRKWESQERVWTYATSVGSFRYYLPEFDSSLPDYSGMFKTVQRQIDLNGARINPSNVYKAIPWTWLVDWVSITGKSIQAVQDASMDNMAARYLYLVHHSVKTLIRRYYLPFNAQSGGSRTLQFSRILDQKQRKEADSPFGFGLSWESLSPKQLAILGALGILRIR
jgi:hypothetical protein